MGMTLTHEQIIEKWDGMAPRERDAWVAEAVFGIDVHYEYSPEGPVYLDAKTLLNGREHIRQYTTLISTAELVLAQIPGKVYIYRKPSGGFVVSFVYSTEGCPECGEEGFSVLAQGIAPTLSEAICLAVLIAKLSKEESE